VITYEHPLSERIRTLLRLEDLFGKTAHFTRQAGAREHHAALVSIFEILDVASRGDLKMDLIQELERQRQSLVGFRNNPEISEDALSGALGEIEQAAAALQAMTGKVGQYLRDNEWLMAIKGRAAIPGGVCEFDLPSYHYWLRQEAAVRQEALQGWLQPMTPLRDALAIVLRLLRASGSPERQTARRGIFQLTLGSGPTPMARAQMVRVSLAASLPYVPEISANRYALNIRFIPQEATPRARLAPDAPDLAFDIVFCNL
jgi:cell division protein ZapD